MTSKPKMLLATIATPNYIPMAKQLFASAHEAGYWQGEYMLLSTGISLEDRNWFESRGILVRDYRPLMTDQEWQVCRDPKKPLKIMPRIVLEKYQLFREEFKQWDVVVYMDTDIIVMGPLVRLSKIKGFWATLDFCAYLKMQFLEDGGYEVLIQNGYDLKAYSFCSGMFAFSSDIIASDTCTKLVELTKRFSAVAYFNDQSILNLFFYKSWNRLSMAYAYMLTYIPSTLFCQPKGALTLHFAGKDRPWESNSAYNRLWLENLYKAEAINFRVPKTLVWQTKMQAFTKETLFAPWLFLFKRRFNETAWYLYLKKIYYKYKI